MAAYTINLTEAISCIDQATPQVYMIVEDVISVVDEDPANSVLMVENMQESIDFADEVTPSSIISLLVEDSVSVVDEDQTSASYLLSLTDNVNASVFLNVYKENADGDLKVESSFDCWVMNNKNQAFSRYTDYNFNSFVEHGNKYYASNETGIYELDVVDDEQYVEAKIKTGFISAGMVKFGIAKVFLYQLSNGVLKLKITNDQGQEFDYDMIDPNTQLSSSSISPGKGLKGYYFQFQLSNDDVSDFEISSIDITPLKTGKKD